MCRIWRGRLDLMLQINDKPTFGLCKDSPHPRLREQRRSGGIAQLLLCSFYADLMDDIRAPFSAALFIAADCAAVRDNDPRELATHENTLGFP